MPSPLLAIFLIVLPVGEQVVCSTENSKPTEASEKCDDICEPNPDAEHVGCRSTCTFWESEDIDLSRVPQILYHYNCFCPGKLCSSPGDYRCTQVTEPVKVSRKGRDEFTHVNTSCVCAAVRSGNSMTSCDRTSIIRKKHGRLFRNPYEM